ncbi:hypothetical protein MPC4_200078 [Methylocella tundrae]|uniref:Uncharacterized protein n=1 Tax=Methylocella tundrae TaxID=227605 RepID=A0A8B6M5S2_METTU|nr:hypothetical protein MPC1_700002 [Methylocella tundrae]VTZ50194.1 hypothetical protein MPC4_200078 [Methylocella tundrae]
MGELAIWFLFEVVTGAHEVQSKYISANAGRELIKSYFTSLTEGLKPDGRRFWKHR